MHSWFSPCSCPVMEGGSCIVIFLQKVLTAKAKTTHVQPAATQKHNRFPAFAGSPSWCRAASGASCCTTGGAHVSVDCAILRTLIESSFSALRVLRGKHRRKNEKRRCRASMADGNPLYSVCFGYYVCRRVESFKLSPRAEPWLHAPAVKTHLSPTPSSCCKQRERAARPQDTLKRMGGRDLHCPFRMSAASCCRVVLWATCLHET